MSVKKLKIDMFGAEGAERFDEAVTAAHRFAQVTDCPPGADVFKWLVSKNDELMAAEYERLAALQKARQSTPAPDCDGEGGMTPDQWETIRKNHDSLKAREAELMDLLNRARLFVTSSELDAEIRLALGLAPNPERTAE